MRNRDDVNFYINFSLYAVLGKLAEADDLLEKHGTAIRRVAAYLEDEMPFQRVPLYRGMLIDASEPVLADARYKFLSWTEDRDVACWFASKRSVISEYVVDQKGADKLRGVVLELAVEKPREVLFHHSWADGWYRLAMMHPHMGIEGARQIAWSLMTQHEVITAPLATLPPAVDVENVDHPPMDELDRRLTPPWIGGVPW